MKRIPCLLYTESFLQETRSSKNTLIHFVQEGHYYFQSFHNSYKCCNDLHNDFHCSLHQTKKRIVLIQEVLLDAHLSVP